MWHMSSPIYHIFGDYTRLLLMEMCYIYQRWKMVKIVLQSFQSTLNIKYPLYVRFSQQQMPEVPDVMKREHETKLKELLSISKSSATKNVSLQRVILGSSLQPLKPEIWNTRSHPYGVSQPKRLLRPSFCFRINLARRILDLLPGLLTSVANMIKMYAKVCSWHSQTAVNLRHKV